MWQRSRYETGTDSNMNTIQLNTSINNEELVVDESIILMGDWEEVCALFGDLDEIPVEFFNGYITVKGIATKSASDEFIMITFDEQVTAPSGGCITFFPEEAEDNSEPTDECEDLTEAPHVSDALQLAVVDAEGCITQYVTLEQLREYLLQDIITDACDLFASTDTQPLVAGDEFVAINGCNLKRIAQSDLRCDDG